ncbi:unnamed protein product [Lathyrus sativus]|nr:unnamed protein product [Lathyrus sativus]
MFDVFTEFGLVLEVYMPTRRDKRGKRFGFVRFRKVLDVRVLATKLDSIFILGKKIHVNLQRFVRGKDKGMHALEK